MSLRLMSDVASESARIQRSFAVPEIPSPALPGRRQQTNQGVWSPFGQPFHSHGEVMLNLGRKPQQVLASEAAPAPASLFPTSRVGTTSSKTTESTGAAPVPREAAVPRQLSHPVVQRGLGLGLGLHPQRFPRELLQSSEQRRISCQVGHDSAQGLAGSQSDPLLMPRLRFDESSFVPSPPSTPAFRAARRGDTETGTNEVQASSLPLTMSEVLPTLPVGARAALEFRGVQRRSRLHLQETLEERQRMRSSILALPHAVCARSVKPLRPQHITHPR